MMITMMIKKRAEGKEGYESTGGLRSPELSPGFVIIIISSSSPEYRVPWSECRQVRQSRQARQSTESECSSD